MKTAVYLCLTLVLSVFAQDDPLTATEDLLAAQADLTMGHEFTENMLQINRNIISSYIEIVEQQLLDSFMDSYSEIQMLYDETVMELSDFEPTPCVDRIRARWELQSTRYGTRLSECLMNSVREIKNWNDIVNDLASVSQFTSTSQIPNAGANVLSQTSDFIIPESLAQPINNRFRDLMFSVLRYMDRFEEFRASVVDNEEEIITELTQCDRSLVAAFNNESRDDLELARRCFDD